MNKCGRSRWRESGATKALVTNKATARNASCLTAGCIYWAQAIAAKSETTLDRRPDDDPAL
ncbi:hypothetical protein [Rhizobium sp. Root1220]|uniref:hypothetical protein n=1 Tax=Rhizobium sp. Root1220 TaxID=1736432 RepID=UPI0006FB38AF|nr:hypothetical protein [Rhizobium sp. Root1220]KQV78181.1 hypothetical protein ASC90_27025 [Rhizobium sp. Root1220]